MVCPRPFGIFLVTSAKEGPLKIFALKTGFIYTQKKKVCSIVRNKFSNTERSSLACIIKLEEF
jgi:hypothetical protein